MSVNRHRDRVNIDRRQMLTRAFGVASAGLVVPSVLAADGHSAATPHLPNDRTSPEASGATRIGSHSERRVVPEGIVALTFDVFGTVVDWRSSIIREGELLSRRKGLEVDWPAFADAWRGGYTPAMNRVRAGELPWMTIDELHRLILEGLLEEHGIRGLTGEDLDNLNRVWHRLMPWPDTVAGLNRLRARYVLATLSNGNVSLLVNMAKNAGLPWDAVLSAELIQRYKPDPEVYLMGARLLGLRTDQVMMVAAHKSDLRAAAAAGLKTAWIPRPLERGPDRPLDTSPDPTFDLTATDFMDLAAQLGA